MQLQPLFVPADCELEHAQREADRRAGLRHLGWCAPVFVNLNHIAINRRTVAALPVSGYLADVADHLLYDRIVGSNVGSQDLLNGVQAVGYCTLKAGRQ